MYELNLYIIIGLVAAMLVSGLASMVAWSEMTSQIKELDAAFQAPLLRPSFGEMRKVLRLHRRYFPSSRLRMIWIALASTPIASMLIMIGSGLRNR